MPEAGTLARIRSRDCGADRPAVFSGPITREDRGGLIKCLIIGGLDSGFRRNDDGGKRLRVVTPAKAGVQVLTYGCSILSIQLRDY